MKTNVVFIGLVLFLIVIGLSYYRSSPPVAPYLRLPNTFSTPTPVPPLYTLGTTYGDGAGGYECSKPIQLKLTKVSSYSPDGGMIDAYVPVDPDEARLFCHMTYAIEYKGKLEILRRPDVLGLVNQYPYKDSSIKALEFQYIQDKDYVHRLLPMYQDREIGCIIVLETPGEKRVYLEDEDLETFEEMDYTAFMQQLNTVSPADRQLFLDNLR